MIEFGLRILQCQAESLFPGTRSLVHGIRHYLFADGPQTARAKLVLYGSVHYQIQHRRFYLKLQPVQLEHLFVLADNGILRFSQNPQQGSPVQAVEIRDYRKPSYNFRYQAVSPQILGRNIFQKIGLVHLLLVYGTVSYHLGIQSLGDTPLDTFECTSADEQYVLRIHLHEFLFRMLASSFRRHIHDVAFKEFQQSLLHALP